MSRPHLLLATLLLSVFWPLCARTQTIEGRRFSDEQVAHVCRAMIRTDALSTSIGPTAIHFNFFGLNNDQITEAINSHGGRTEKAMGMTKYTPDYRFFTKRNVLGLPVDGRWCWRDEVHLEMARAPVEVYVSNDYRDNLCIQRAIYHHEMAHVGVFHSYLRYLASVIQERHGKAIDDIRVSRTRPSEQQDDRPELLEKLRQLVEAALPRIPEINNEVDSAEEVQRLWAEMQDCQKPASQPSPAKATASPTTVTSSKLRPLF